MQIRYHNVHESRSQLADCDNLPICFGRSTKSNIRLDSPYVSDVAAILRRTSAGLTLHVQNENGCRVDGRTIDSGRSILLSDKAKFELFPFEFTLVASDEVDNSVGEEQLAEQKNAFVREVHRTLLDRMDLANRRDAALTVQRVIEIESNVAPISQQLGLETPQRHAVAAGLAFDCVQGELIDRVLNQQSEVQSELTADRNAVWRPFQTANESRERELNLLIRRLENLLLLNDADKLSRRIAQIEQGFADAWHKETPQLRSQLKQYLAMRRVTKLVKDSLFGYGPLEDLIQLPAISEIMVLGSDAIFVERDGVLENSGRRFPDEKTTLLVINRIVSRVGRRVDRSQPIADARLSDGSRVNAVLPPVALDGPLLTIRRFPAEAMTIERLIHEKRSLTSQAATFLNACILGRRNILISGGTGTGKTTMLNCLANWIPDEERIVTIEDTAELQIRKRHVARMETREANIEGEGELGISDLVRNALRMRPDRIVVGECRGTEALWMLQAMNTGHDGCMTTVHANSAREALLRLEVLVQSGSSLPVESIQRQISAAIDVVIQLSRLSDGSRVVSEIVEILPASPDDPAIRTRTLFSGNSPDGLTATGHLPTFAQHLISRGLLKPEQLFPQASAPETEVQQETGP